VTDQQQMERPRLVLIDGYGLIFRAYHALPPTMATRSGEQTNAVFGFASMLLDVIRQHHPEYIAVALEGGRTFRHDSYDGYKANRSAMPDDLRQQIGRVRELINALNVPIFEREGYEADDVIGSLARSCATDGFDVVIVTGDSDLLQLVDDHVIAVLPGARRFGEFRQFDIPAVVDRYGFGPDLVPDYKALVGDTSDNIPGVPGIGEKTAKALISEFGPIESIIEHVDQITPPRAQKALAAHVEEAKFSKHLATIVRDLEVPFSPEEAKVSSYDRNAVIEIFRELEFRNLIGKLPESDSLTDEAPAPPNASEAPVEREPSVRTLIKSKDDLEHLATRTRATGEYAVDVETTSTDPMSAELVGIAIAVSPTEGYYIPVGHSEWVNVTSDDVRDIIGPVLGDPLLKGYTHHGKYDLQVLERHGYEIGNIAFDTMVAAYLLGENSLRLKDLAFTRLGIQMTEIEELIGSGRNQLTMNMVSAEQAAEYASGDVEATFSLVEYFRPEIVVNNQQQLLETIELPLIPVLVRMERTGVAIDTDYLQQLSDEITSRFGQIEQEIYQLVGRTFNINSTRQIATLLFEELKLPAGRRTKTGYSVDSDVLENLRDSHPVVGLVLEYRSLGKLKSTYVDALPLQVNPKTGRVHTNYNQTVAATGRLSSVNPNLQNIPIRTELGRRVREAFVADRRPSSRLFDDAILLAADYSQIELRLMAHMSGEPFLVEAFRAGEDIHRATAALVYGVDPENVTADMRRVAKTVNFGLLYGMQAFGLSRDTGLSRADAQRFIDQYWARLPRVRAFFDETLQFGVTNGYVESMSGRRRSAPDLTSSNGQRRMAAERMSINMPLQGSAADIMKIAMLRLDERIKQEKLPAAMILQVHDELVLEVDARSVEEVGRHIRDVMEHAWQLSVPLEADVSVGNNWNDMSPIDV
jgi:DNA polymerase-1